MPTSATKTTSMFRMEYAISEKIDASAEAVWALLTDAAAFPNWNSTVTSIEGTIAEGQALKLKVPTAKDRTFTPKVSNVVPARSMVWRCSVATGLRSASLAR